ncbi:hypothetical protein BZG36_02280 [Bifiguratus adelaidae]|uniref:DNA repair protein RAD51 homolog 3 n=1 Tax=Bifiguratus adelaidae TaxID=1938954 RepID=A0A261XY60_9FUNG|nr:hypothetical protein BZG36_02280 [Bifiguratus adelaidae]
MPSVFASVPIAATLRTQLASCGLRTAEAIKNLSAEQLSHQLQISYEEASELLQAVQAASTPKPRSALDSLSQQLQQSNISFSSNALDSLFGGAGIPTAKVIEICGCPGTGKTQIALQLSANVICNPEGDQPCRSIYIDTEGSFMAARLRDMLPTVSDLSTQDDNSPLDNLYYYRVCNHLELLALVKSLDQQLEDHNNVRLVVIDSIAFLMRMNLEDAGLRARLLTTIGQTLLRLARAHRLTVLLLNHINSKMASDDFLPALGDSWGHIVPNRLLLYEDKGRRYARLYKSSNLPDKTVPFRITSQGVRDTIPDQGHDQSLKRNYFTDDENSLPDVYEE